jgi:hypothetical protein
MTMTTTETTSETTSETTATTYLDVLPVRGGKRQAMEWMPHTSDFAHGEGFVILTSKTDRTSYAVSECPEATGRCFLFSKVKPGTGTAKNKDSYIVRCLTAGDKDVDTCECDGFRRWGWCKHSDAARTLLMNRWL